MKYKLTVSVVLFNTDSCEIENIIKIFEQSGLSLKVFFIDNSSSKNLGLIIPRNEVFEYIHSGKNLGFGAGHNIAINKAKEISEFHLVLNADVDFDVSILNEMIAYMKKHDDIGMMGPKVYNPDGSIQYSVKLLPTPTKLLIRRFIPIKFLREKIDNLYDLKFFGFDQIIEAPFLLGCFLLINTKVFKEVSGFDERFFMYMEDVDLTRRVGEYYKTIYYPNISIFHQHSRASYKDRKLLNYHIISTIKYFNRWGWFLDRRRMEINRNIVLHIREFNKF